MAQLSREAQERLQSRAAIVRKQMQGSGRDFAKWVSLTGARAMAKPGESVIVRILPRWDFYAKRYRRKADGTVLDLAPTQEYFADEADIPAREHWYDDVSNNGKRTRDWCRKVLGEEEPCPACEAAMALGSGGEAEQDIGWRMRAQDVYLYNILIRGQEFTEQGQPDVRIFTASSTVWLQIAEICTGRKGSENAPITDDATTQQNFGRALGDIADWGSGYDLQLVRSTGEGGDRHKVYPARIPTAVFSPEQLAAHPKTATTPALYELLLQKLHDLPKALLDDVLSYEDMYRKVYGLGPEAARVAGPLSPAASGPVGPAAPGPGAGFMGPGPAATATPGPGAGFMGPGDVGPGTTEPGAPGTADAPPFNPDDPFGTGAGFTLPDAGAPAPGPGAPPLAPPPVASTPAPPPAAPVGRAPLPRPPVRSGGPTGGPPRGGRRR